MFPYFGQTPLLLRASSLSIPQMQAPETGGLVFGTSFSILDVYHWLLNLGTDSSSHRACLDNINCSRANWRETKKPNYHQNPSNSSQMQLDYASQQQNKTFCLLLSKTVCVLVEKHENIGEHICNVQGYINQLYLQRQLCSISLYLVEVAGLWFVSFTESVVCSVKH